MSEEEALIYAILHSNGDETPSLMYADWLDDHDRPREAAWHRRDPSTALLQAIADDPKNHAPVLAYANWLEGRNRGVDAARAKFIRLQLQQRQCHDNQNAAGRQHAREQARELLHQDQALREALREETRAGRMSEYFSSAESYLDYTNDAEVREIERPVFEALFWRGVAEYMQIAPAGHADAASAMEQTIPQLNAVSQPIHDLMIQLSGGISLDHLARLDLPCLRVLHVTGGRNPADRAIGGLENLARLSELDCMGFPVDRAVAESFIDTPMRKLRQLHINALDYDLDPEGLEILLDNPLLAGTIINTGDEGRSHNTELSRAHRNVPVDTLKRLVQHNVNASHTQDKPYTPPRFIMRIIHGRGLYVFSDRWQPVYPDTPDTRANAADISAQQASQEVGGQ